MLLNYDTTVLPRVRLMGRIRYHEPWCHFSRVIDEYILYVVRDGDLYIEENGVQMHLRAGDFLLLEPNLPHTGYKAASCDYYYAHFKQDRITRAADDETALEAVLETRRKSMTSYNPRRDRSNRPDGLHPQTLSYRGGGLPVYPACRR